MTPKPWYQSRTLWVNALLILAYLLTQLPGLPHIPADWAPYCVLAVGAINMYLRLISATPLATPLAPKPPDA